MTRKKKAAKFVYCQIPDGEDLLAVLGSSGIRSYGMDAHGKADLTNHFHNLTEIGICRRGSGSLLFQNEKMDYRENTVVVIPANTPHNIMSNDKEKSFWEFLYIDTLEFLKNVSFGERDTQRFASRIESHPIKRQKEEIPLFIRELDCLMDQIRVQDYGYRNCVKGLLYTLLMEIVKMNADEFASEKMRDTAVYVNDDRSEKLQLALTFVEEHFAEDIKISDIAKAAYISESYLRKIFAEKYDVTPIQYVNYIRIQEACKLMKKKKLNINEAAQKVGFNNIATFITNFKKIKKQTPGQWLKEAQKNLGENLHKQQ